MPTKAPADKELIAISILALGTTLYVTADQALRNTSNAPYSPLWAILNPLYTTQTPYRAYLVVYEAIAIGGMLYAVRNWALPQMIAYLQAGALFTFAALHWHQNITVVAFAWTAYYARPLALLALQKLPLGWSLDLNDAHYACFTTCFQYAGNAAHEPWIGLLQRSTLHTATYAILLIVTAYPLVARWTVNRRPNPAPVHGGAA